MDRRSFLAGTGAVLLTAPLGANEPSESFQIPLRPLAGMRLYYRNNMVSTGSGPSRQIVDTQTVTFVLDVLAPDASGFDITVTLDGTLLPVVARLSHSGDLRELVFDASVPQGRKEFLAGLLIFRLTRLSVVNAHSWTRKESRPAILSMPLGWETLEPVTRVNFWGNATFRQITTIFGRPAAEFDVSWVVGPRITGLSEKLEFTGHYWADLATGFQLRSILTGVVNASAGGKTVRVEQTQEDVLVFEDSKGL